MSMTIDFTAPPPGLDGLTRFTLDELDDSGLLFALRSLESDVRLFVVPPEAYFEDYTPDVGDEARAALGDDDPLLLVVVRPSEDGEPPTANLLAPVAINPRTGAATQVVLDDSPWPLRAPIGA